MGMHVLPRKVFDPKGLQVKYSRISTYTSQLRPVPPLLASADVASYVSTREAGAIRVHASIVRRLRIWSKGCWSQRNELGLWKTAPSRLPEEVQAPKAAIFKSAIVRGGCFRLPLKIFFRPLGAGLFCHLYPRLTAWAAFFRRFAATNSFQVSWLRTMDFFHLDSVKRVLISASESLVRQLRNFLHYGVGIALVLGNFRGEGIYVSEAGACFLEHGVAQHCY
jgi:hypothetical protein